MHTIDVEYEGRTWYAHHNSDLSGEVIFTRDTIEPYVVECIAEVPGIVIKRLVANYIRDQRIAKLEEMTDEELLS